VKSETMQDKLIPLCRHYEHTAKTTDKKQDFDPDWCLYVQERNDSQELRW